ncbi:FecR family protein [Pedobacter sp. PLR]|uniref:FecR family protein n=1 Tax=Pedobacter sp. PLR TaxID=2994465 RepID=UPI0022460E01|nr:FecR family protein [Pedobacter sp. PLR]MCX2452244.1 FecR family protein [Pedobacter sp. PLR]
MTPISRSDLNRLADKWLKGTLTPKEKEILDKWYDLETAEPLQWTGGDESEEELNIRLFSNIKNGRQDTRVLKIRWSIAVAASLLLFYSIAYFYSPGTKDKNKKEQITNAGSIHPGTNKAILTLANGEKISLNDSISGQVALQSGMEITKTANGALVYEIVNSISNENAALQYNTIEAPLGGQWQVVLPDGSHVWLNAKSSLKYPVKFAGGERKVELHGEAYFEIAKVKGIPFRVQSNNQVIEVLGTHFNVNAYSDEASTITTLIEGSVKVSATFLNNKLSKDLILQPNEQSILSQKDVQVISVDAGSAIAWKNGLFLLEDEGLESIMRRISRWYDVEVVYKDVDKTIQFGGSVSRYENVAQVLDKLELAGGVHFKIEGRRIIVMK